jgi:hypothetical protein
MASALAHKRRRDTHVLFAVHYEDGGSGYVRVPPDVARVGLTEEVREVCREAQARWELRQGKIASVQPVH